MRCQTICLERVYTPDSTSAIKEATRQVKEQHPDVRLRRSWLDGNWWMVEFQILEGSGS